MNEQAPLYCELAEAPFDGHAFWIFAGDRRLRAAVWRGSGRGTVLIFTGRTEYIEKYGRVVTLLRDRGFAVAVLDWRGQGLSDRPLANRMKGHVAVFSAYQSDVQAFMSAPEVADLPAPHVLLCHSMGGCIGMRSLLDERVTPAAAIMSAPMLGIELTPAMRFGARVAIGLARRFGFEHAFAPSPKPGLPYVDAQAFDGNLLTNDPEHYAWFIKHLEAERGFALGAPTLKWMRRAFEETEALARAPAPDTPMLTFLGDEEEIVAPDAIRAFDAKAPKCRLVELPRARHEVLMETEAVRKQLWGEIDRFLSDQGV